ncbi:MAG TPA: NUDIX hydrolase [Myxococcales bacterium]
MPRDPIPTWNFALVVVRRGDEYLLVQESKDDQAWYLPGGRVELGESFVETAERETLEEAGVRVEVTGVLRVEHTPYPDATARCRVWFLAHPKGDPTPKSAPDEHSLSARWLKIEEVSKLPLRGEEALDALCALAAGLPVAPLSVLTHEGAPWPKGR